MLTFHNIVDFLMIFFIAFLVDRHLRLIQKYETLQIAMSQRDGQQCQQAGMVGSMAQSSTVPSIESTSSSLSHQMHESYWKSSDTHPGSLSNDKGGERQLAYSLLSSSHPPEFVINPKETEVNVAVTSETHDLNYNEFQDTDFIPETDQIVIEKISPIQSTSKISRQDEPKDFHNETRPNTSYLLSSTYPSYTSSSSVLQRPIDESIDDYYNLPVEQTHSGDYVDDSKEKENNLLPSISSMDNLGRARLKNINVLETSVDSNVIEKAIQTEVPEAVPLHTRTSMAMMPPVLSDHDDNHMSPLLTTAKDIIYKSDQSLSEDINEHGQNKKATPFLKLKPDAVSRENVEEQIDTIRKVDEVNMAEGGDIIREEEDEGLEIDFKKNFSGILSTKGDRDLLTGGSSATCGMKKPGNRYCNFKNICYNAQKRDFIFFKGLDSAIKSDDTSEDVKDALTISLSTLSEHNAFMFSLITLPVEALASFSFSIISQKSVAISRFKPDNIMHVLHDDILPLYQTLRELDFPRKGNTFDTMVVFTDVYDKGDYFDLYSALSNVRPLSLEMFNKSRHLVCFQNIHVGLLTSTVWYQYGFMEPQGPVADVDQQAFYSIQEASKYIGTRLKSQCFMCNQKDYLVLLSRKDNRLILNEGELVVSLSQKTRLKVLSVSLETHSLSDVITIVRSSRGIIGMHGSLVSLAIFLTPGGVVVELFPYAINPSHYTPFKTLSVLPGSNLEYRTWTNHDRQKSVPHPDRPPQEGGIQHLPFVVQKEIESQTEVPEHLCCDNPSWLYHIYQDTFVNISAVVSLTLEALNAQQSVFSSVKPQNQNTKRSIPDIPGPIEYVRCLKNSDKSLMMETDSDFTVSWTSHWSIQYYSAPQKLRYEVIVQAQDDASESKVSTLSLDVLSYSFDSFSRSKASAYNVWITVVVADSSTRSQTKHVSCP